MWNNYTSVFIEPPAILIQFAPYSLTAMLLRSVPFSVLYKYGPLALQIFRIKFCMDFS